MALHRDAKLELLRRVPLLADCSPAELAEIAGVADEVDVAEGVAVMREGETGREFVVVVEGTVEVSKAGQAVRVKGGQEFFGEVALLADVPRTATVTTTSPARLLVIPASAFRHLLERSPSIALKLLRALAARVAPDTV